MKSIKVVAVFLAFCVLSASLREVTTLDQMRGPNRRWIWLRLKSVLDEPQRYDFAFVGSSKTLNGIKPDALDRLMPGTRSLNLGHFKFGHDADYYAVERLLARHEVGRLVVEIPPEVVDDVHDATKHVIGLDELPGELRAALHEIDLVDAITYSSAFKQRVGRVSRYAGTLGFSLPVHAILRTKAWITGTRYDKPGVNRRWDHTRGFDFNDRSIEQKAEFLEYWQRRPHPKTLVRPGAPRTGVPDVPEPGSRQDFYVRRLASLAEEHGTQLSFLQIPGLWRFAPSLARYAYYRQFGDVLIPDLTQLYRVKYYADPHHFYQEGTEVFCEEVARLLQEGPQVSPYHGLYRRLDREADAR